MPKFEYFTDDEIKLQIKKSKLDVNEPIKFKLIDADIRPGKFNGDQLIVTLETYQNDNKFFNLVDYFPVNCRGYDLHRFKQFLRSIGCISMYENQEDIAPYSLLSKTRWGFLMGENSQYKCKQTGEMKPCIKIKEYIQQKQSEDTLMNKSYLNQDTIDEPNDDIPF